MRAGPRGWFGRIVRLQEGRPYHLLTVLCFAAFVGLVRLAEELALGLRPVDHLPARALQFVSFYLMAFFSYTAALRLVVPQPWRRTINVVLIGILCGIVPPLIDLAVYGRAGFGYAFAPLSRWAAWIYAPAAGFTLGESAVLWATVALCGLYTLHKTGSPLRATAGLALGYGAALFNSSAMFTLASHLGEWLSPRARLPSDTVTWQLGATLALYLALQPGLARGLARRLSHALPFGLIYLAGAAFKGGLDARVAAGALLPLFAFCVAIAQNDHHDHDADAPQGRERYLDAEDVALLDALMLGLTLALLLAGSLVGVGLLVFFVAAVLYNHPAYRAKAFFPSNLKIEGAWGAAACFAGVAAAAERGVPVLHCALDPLPAQALARAFDVPTLALLLLVFGGWSLVAGLKDYKDVRADRRAGVRTIYTLALRRGWGLRRTHQALKLAACGALLAPFPLLHAAGRVPLGAGAGGLLLAGALWAAMSSAPSARRFQWALAAINGYLAYVTVLLVRYGAGAD